jgi:phenylacetate-CoA ligase
MIEGIQGRIEEALTLKGKDKNVTIHPVGFHRIMDSVYLSAWQIV